MKNVITHNENKTYSEVKNLGDSVNFLVKVTKETYVAPNVGLAPDNISKKIFIPGSGLNGQHYCFLIDIQSSEVICWTINLYDYFQHIYINMIGVDNMKAPWNRTPYNYIEVSHFIHSAEIYNGWIYVSFFHGGFILGLEINTEEYKIIYDKNINYHPMYSSTNKIKNGKIYFSRWPSIDTFYRAEDRTKKVAIECGIYNIEDDKFHILHRLNGPDAIHFTDISPDENNIFLVEMSQNPNISFPLDEELETLTTKSKKKIIEGKISLSEIISISKDGKQINRYYLPSGPAHIEWDDKEENVFYLSSHNLVTNNKYLYTFGNAKVDKYYLTGGNIKLISSYSSDELLRGQSHKKTNYEGSELLVISGYRDQLELIDSNTMQFYKRIRLNNNTELQPKFELGPVRYLPQKIDTTPYTADTEPGTPFLYLSSLHSLDVYDISEHRVLVSISYKADKPVVFIGHSAKV